MKRVNRIFRLYIRVTKAEYEKVSALAELTGLSMSEYIRRRTLGFRVVSKVDIRVLGELRRQGSLLKLINNESHGIYSAKMAEALDALTSYTHALERNLS